jgi:hypothetical protein
MNWLDPNVIVLVTTGTLFLAVLAFYFLRAYRDSKSSKCVFCGKHGPRRKSEYELDMNHPDWGVLEATTSLSYVKYHGIYGKRDSSVEFHFHPTCVKDVLENPKEYGHSKVDLAIEIVDRLADQKQKEEAAKRQQLHDAMVKQAQIKAARERIKYVDLFSG